MQVNASLNNNFRAKQTRQLQESHLSAALRARRHINKRSRLQANLHRAAKQWKSFVHLPFD